MKTREYDELRTKAALTPSRFIANVATMIFSEETMRKSSVTGKRCNAHPYKDGKRRAAKPALDPKGLDAVAAITRFWMASSSQPKYDEDDIIREVSSIRTVIAKKIWDLNRPSKATKATESETETPPPVTDSDAPESGDDQPQGPQDQPSQRVTHTTEIESQDEASDQNNREPEAVDDSESLHGEQQPDENLMDVSANESTGGFLKEPCAIPVAADQDQNSNENEPDYDDFEELKKPHPRPESLDADSEEGLRLTKKPKISDSIAK